jgi:DNA primase
MKTDTAAIKAANPIRTVAERYTTLDGKLGNGPCPQCGGTDRFFIHRDGAHFQCRGCEKKGDVIELVMWVEGIDFPTACKILSGEPGIGVSNRSFPSTAAPKKPAEKPQQWREANWQRQAKQIAERAHADLMDSPKGRNAREYLVTRGLLADTWRAFGLGFVAEQFDPKNKSKRPAIVIPWMLEGCITALKFRFIDDIAAADKTRRFTQKAGSDPLVFGSQCAKDADTLLAIEGELNALSAWQVLQGEGIDVLSVGSEANLSRLPILAKNYNALVTWLDSGEKVIKAAQSLDHPNKALMQSPKGMDANDVLVQHGADTLRGLILNFAKPQPAQEPRARSYADGINPARSYCDAMTEKVLAVLEATPDNAEAQRLHELLRVFDVAAAGSDAAGIAWLESNRDEVRRLRNAVGLAPPDEPTLSGKDLAQAARVIFTEGDHA